MDRTETMLKQLIRYSEAYYAGKQLIDDESFDALEEEFRKIDPNNDYFKKNRESAGYGTKYPHIYEFIGSIEKIHSISESKLLSYKDDISLSAKLDGTSMVAYYKDGRLVHALTRGDGNYGLDVTQHYEAITLKYRLNIPKSFTGAIRGEVVFSNQNWEMFKSIHPEAKMARNSGTGLINQKTAQPEASLLDFITYDVIASPVKVNNVFQFLLKLGFRVAPYINPGYEATEESLKSLFNYWSTLYPLDGIVIRKDIPEFRGNLFYLNKQQEAFKFQAETKLCKVTSITWGLGRTGKLIPVIQIEPTELSGALVTNVTGHNAKTILERNINAEAYITVRRSGEVIPYLDEVVTPVVATLPTTCPHCGQPLTWTDTKVDLICTNDDCSGQQFKKMANYILTLCKDIKGVGDSFLEGFISYFKATDIKDLMIKVNEYKDETITTLGKADNIIAKKVIATLTNKKLSGTDFLQGLGIRFLGNSFATELCNSPLSHKLFTAIKNNNIEEVTKTILDILPGKVALANSISDSTALISAIVGVLTNYEQTLNYKTIEESNEQQIRFYAVTGQVSKPRKEFEAELLSKGWKMTETITKAEFLINEDTASNSGKNLKAKQANKPIITESDFRTTYLV